MTPANSFHREVKRRNAIWPSPLCASLLCAAGPIRQCVIWPEETALHSKSSTWLTAGVTVEWRVPGSCRSCWAQSFVSLATEKTNVAHQAQKPGRCQPDSAILSVTLQCGRWKGERSGVEQRELTQRTLCFWSRDLFLKLGHVAVIGCPLKAGYAEQISPYLSCPFLLTWVQVSLQKDPDCRHCLLLETLMQIYRKSDFGLSCLKLIYISATLSNPQKVACPESNSILCVLYRAQRHTTWPFLIECLQMRWMPFQTVCSPTPCKCLPCYLGMFVQRI